MKGCGAGRGRAGRGGGVLGVRRCGRRAPALLSERNVRRLHHCGGTAGGGGSAQQRPRRRAPGTAGTEPPLPARCCPPLPAPAQGHRGAWHQPPAACAAGRGCCISPAPSRSSRPGAAGGAGGGHEGAPGAAAAVPAGSPGRRSPPSIRSDPAPPAPAPAPGPLPAPPPRPERAAGPGAAGQDHPGGAAPRSRQHPRGAAPGRGSAASRCLSDNLRRSGLRSRTGHGAGAEAGPLPGASAASTKLSWGQRYQGPRGQGVRCPGRSQGELPSGTGCAPSPCPVGAAGDCKWESREVRAKEFANTFFSATRIPLHVNRNRGRPGAK
ncbi:RING finger protein 208 isoform X1 [Agelaius phoeniceus]|uniref:RING finger protein 208 isoform X1 n=1 Tax=Agelaius phoeniceus TaxID=39638 RepID=UPI0040550C3A